MDGLGMNERDLEPEEPTSRRPVDQLSAGRFELVQRRAEILRFEGDVVHPRTAPGEEAADRCVIGHRRHELEPTLTHEQRSSLDTLVDE